MFLHGSRGLRLPAAVLGAALALLLADGVYAGLRFRSVFEKAACGLKSAAVTLEDLDAAGTTKRLLMALEQIDEARSYLRHAGLKVVGALPSAERNLRALDALAEAAEEAGRAGLVGAAAARELGLDADASLAALYRNGRFDLEAFEGIDSAIDEGRAHLYRAKDLLAGAPNDLLGPIARGRAAAARMVATATRQLDETKVVVDDVPALLGAGGVRRYFLAFQAPSEARGGGGLIGVYGILEADRGRLDLLRVAPIRDLVSRLRQDVAAPPWYRHLYGGLDGLGGWREANSSPTFPAVARVLLRMYARSTGETLDGVLAMDPLVVAELLRATGPIRADGVPVPVTADNAGRLLMRDIYLRFEGREDDQNEFLRDLVDKIWDRFGSGDVDGKRLARALGRSIGSQRLKFYSAVPSEADAIRALQIDGDPRRFGPMTQMIFHNNFAASKIDWYLYRSQRTKVVIDGDGSAHVVTSLSLYNDAPHGRRSLLKKSDVNELPSGVNLMGVHFMLPERARVGDMYFGSSFANRFTGKEAGRYPEVWAPLQLKVQDEVEVSVSYRVPDMVSFHKGRARFEMTLLPQALVRPDEYRLEIVAPSGYRIGEKGADRIEIAGRLEQPRTIRRAVYSPDAEAYGRAPALSC